MTWPFLRASLKAVAACNICDLQNSPKLAPQRKHQNLKDNFYNQILARLS